MSKTLFKKGAAFIPSLAFLFSSTNLVIELGVILWLLLGWQFTLGEWIGGLVLIAMMSVLVKLTYPEALVEEARRHVDAASGHDHGSMEGEGACPRAPARSRDARRDRAERRDGFLDALEGSAVGFLIAGVLAAFVPDARMERALLTARRRACSPSANALLGPLVAIFSFVCSIGNVPLAAILGRAASRSAACSRFSTPT